MICEPILLVFCAIKSYSDIHTAKMALFSEEPVVVMNKTHEYMNKNAVDEKQPTSMTMVQLIFYTLVIVVYSSSSLSSAMRAHKRGFAVHLQETMQFTPAAAQEQFFVVVHFFTTLTVGVWQTKASPVCPS